MASQPSGYSLADVSAGSFWFYRSGGKEIGPLSTGRIRQLAKQGKLFPDDEVRLGRVGDWVAAAEVEGLFRGLKSASRAEAAAARKEEAANRKSEVRENPNSKSRLGAALSDRISDAVDWGKSSFDLLRIVVSWVCLAIVVVTLVLVIARNVSFDWGSGSADPYQSLTTSWDELKSLRDAGADETQWDEFGSQSETAFAPIIVRLEQKAGSHDRYSQQLLWAARDCWPEMLADARVEPNDAEAHFEKHLANAQMLKQGRQLYPSAQRTGGAAAFNSNVFLRLYGDWLVAGMVLVDAILALLFARWWWRRRL